VLTKRGLLVATFDRSRRRARLLTRLFWICGLAAAPFWDSSSPAADKNKDKAAATPARGRPFDDVLSERIITAAQEEPVFIDIDTGRWMTAPASLLTRDNDGKSVEEWAFPEALTRWIRQSGIALAMQTDGQSISLVGFDLRVGDLMAEQFNKSEADVAKAVSPIRRDGVQWITMRRKIAKGALVRCTPFVTREGGLGTFSPSITDAWGPNSIQFDYRLTRRPHVPKLTGQPVLAVYQPQILGQMATFLIVDVTDNKLCLRTPGSATQIEISADEVVMRESTHAELRAVRLSTGTLDIDAPAERVTVNGRGTSATLRRIGNRVQVEHKNRIAESDAIILWMPELDIPDKRLNWRVVKPEPKRSPL
jgi:hypothetical protein